MWLKLFFLTAISPELLTHSYPIERTFCAGDHSTEILCPFRNNANVKIVIEQQLSGQRLRIDCNTNDVGLHDRLPAWRIVDTVIFSGCSMAPNDSIRRILELWATMAPIHTTNTASIDQFSGYAVDGLQSIRSLHLSGNRIPILRKHLFDGMASITHLNLSENIIDSIDDNALEELSNLKEFHLYFNQLNKLPMQLLSLNMALTSVALINNQWIDSRLPNGLLKNLPALTKIIISGYECQQLPADLFTNSTNIEHLSLAHNGLTYLPDILFDTQVNLLVLDLSFNELTVIDDALFIDTEKLKVLRLSHNRLSNISR